MQKLEWRTLYRMAIFATVALLLMAGRLVAQTDGDQEKQPQEQTQAKEQDQEQSSTAAEQEGRESSEQSQPATQARLAIPRVTGTVIRWTGNRIDLRTPEGKTQKVAVNPETEQLVEISEGAEVTVEYRRKISGFVIAERVRSVEDDAPQSGAVAAPAKERNALTGSVVTWNSAALVLRTDAGEVTLFLSPETEYLVKSLPSGLRVSVEYLENPEGSKLATTVRPAKPENSAGDESAPGSAEPAPVDSPPGVDDDDRL